jgi:transcriptional regulator with XRE-family HTH domain
MAYLTSAEIAAVRQKPRARRLRAAVRVSEFTYVSLAAKVGLSRAHLAAAATGRQSLSLSMKLRVGRALGVPPAVLWPELETLALEILQGVRGGAK